MSCSPSISGLWLLSKKARTRQTQVFAQGTCKNHLSHLRLFLYFAAYYGLPNPPATLHTLLLFVEFLAGSFTAPKAVTNALASLRFHHERLGFPLHPFEHISLRLALRSLPFTTLGPPFRGGREFRMLGLPLQGAFCFCLLYIRETGFFGPSAGVPF